MNPMTVQLQYGTDGLTLTLPAGVESTVIEPRFIPGLADEPAGFIDAVRHPMATRPLRDLLGSKNRIAVVIPDSTRPFPSERILNWFLAECAHVPDDQITIVVGTGSHRANTRGELAHMVGPEVLRRCRVVNHNAHDPVTMLEAGREAGAEPVLLNRDYVEADRRIIMGFVEPHFMAGFSGGYKAVFPGIADIASIMRYHGAEIIGDPGSTWGRTEGNPTQNRLRANGSLLPVDFCVNVTLNRDHDITGFFCGDVFSAHAAACRAARETGMIACPCPYPVVVTTNGGAPLDQNLYQTVKGMSAAAEIVAPGGLILCAARCNDGFPDHGNFKKLLFDHDSPESILDTINTPGFSMFDQWEAQILAGICMKARVALYSELPPEEVARAYITPVSDLNRFLADAVESLPGGSPIAILPQGPMTIPYLRPVGLV